MPRPSIEVEGARELRAALKAAADDASDLKQAHRDAGNVVVDAARPITPQLSGRLLASTRAMGAKAGATVKSGGGSILYAGVQHFGWAAHGIEAHPYLYDALDARRAEVVDVYQKRINAITDRINT